MAAAGGPAVGRHPTGRSDGSLRSGLLSPQVPRTAWGRFESTLDEYFMMSHRGTDLATEFRAGTTAFLASSNNFVVNAHIMERAGISSDISVVSGAFAAAVTCILSGLFSNLPLGVAPSVGPNVFLAFSLVAKHVVDTDEALAISAACGSILLFLSVTPVLKVVLGLVPLCIKYGLIIGTGLLTALIGLKSIGVVVADTGPANDIVALGELKDTPVLIAAIFLILMASMLHRGVKGAVLIGMIGATITDWIVKDEWPDTFVNLSGLNWYPLNFGVLVHFNAWVQVMALLLMLLFSISGAVIGSARMAGVLRPDGSIPGSTAVYVCCGFGTVLSACLGTAPIFVSMSAAAGIRDGGRTGLMSIVIGGWCLLTAFVFSPMAADIPACAVAPVLILVGVSMIGEAKEVQWWSMQEALPAFLCAIFQPFTYSVANGIYAGLGISFVLFFTTGSFISYLPGRKERIESEIVANRSKTLDSAELAHWSDIKTKRALSQTHSQRNIIQSIGEDLDELGGATAGSSPPVGVTRSHQGFRRKGSVTFGALPSRFAISQQELASIQASTVGTDDDHQHIRDTFSKVGRSNRLQAMSMIESAAKLVGLDGKEIREVVEQRMLGGGRNAEAHALGGICGSEVDLTREVWSQSHGDIAGLAEKEFMQAAPFIAAAARRRRFRQNNSFAHFDPDRLEIIQSAHVRDMDDELQ